MSENISWVKKGLEVLKNIKKFKVINDRVQMMSQIIYMHNAIHNSVVGWANWFNNWIGIELNKKMNIENKNVVTLTDKELADLHNVMRQFALDYIKYDIKVTEIIDKRSKKVSKVKNLLERMGKAVV